MNRGGFSAESVARFSSHNYPRLSRRLRRRSAWGIFGGFLFVPALLFVFLLPDNSESKPELEKTPPPPAPVVETKAFEESVPAPEAVVNTRKLKPRPPLVETVEEPSAGVWRSRRCPRHSPTCGSS